ncbi:MAG: phospholipid carrier-dependent glycosyltransferase [Devosiaceae bacterium]
MAKPPKDQDTPPASAEDNTESSASKKGPTKPASGKPARPRTRRVPVKKTPAKSAAAGPQRRKRAAAKAGTKAVTQASTKAPAFAATIAQDAAKVAGLWTDEPVATAQPSVIAPTIAKPETGKTSGFITRARQKARAAVAKQKSAPAQTAIPVDAAVASASPGARLAEAADITPSQLESAPGTMPEHTPKADWSRYIPRWTWVDAWAAKLTPAFDAVASIRLIAVLCIGFIAITAFTPGFTTIPPVDRDESRFSQASRQMVNTQDFVEIRFQSGPRYQKPIGIYWLQSVAVTLYGAEDGQAPIWVYRTVSFVGAVAAAMLVYWLALAFGAPPVAFAAGVLVALTILLGAEARLAKTDAMLFAMILVTQGVLARAFLGKRDSSVKGWHAGLFWTAAAAGILIKGPILPVVVGSTALVASLFERKTAWLRRLRPGLGIMWMLILVLPWFIAIGLTSAGEFYAQSIGRDLLEKIGTSRERPFVPPGVFTFGFFPGLGWPLAPFAFLAIPFAIASWHDKSTRFLVAWIVPTLLIFELSATKLPHYILPIYPALAILAARMVVYEKIPNGWLAGIAKALFILIPLAAVIGMPVVLYLYGDSISPLGTFLGVIGLIFMIGAFLLMLRSHARASLVVTVVGTLLLYTSAFGFHVPAARTIWITPQLVATLDNVRCENPEIASLGYNEPSLVLMTRTDLRTLTSARAAADFLSEGPCRAAFIDAPFVEDMFAEIAATSPEETAAAPSVRLISRVEGININGGDELNMHVFAAGE